MLKQDVEFWNQAHKLAERWYFQNFLYVPQMIINIISILMKNKIKWNVEIFLFTKYLSKRSKIFSNSNLFILLLVPFWCLILKFRFLSMVVYSSNSLTIQEFSDPDPGERKVESINRIPIIDFPIPRVSVFHSSAPRCCTWMNLAASNLKKLSSRFQRVQRSSS